MPFLRLFLTSNDKLKALKTNKKREIFIYKLVYVT